MTNHEGDEPATDPIAALIEADKHLKAGLYVNNSTAFIAAAVNAMPAIVAMVEENESRLRDWAKAQLEIERLRAELSTQKELQEAFAKSVGRLTEDNAGLRAELADRNDQLERTQRNLGNVCAELAEIKQAISDPENQPSQYGTVPLAMYEKSQVELEEKAKALDDLAGIYLIERAELAECRKAMQSVSDVVLGWETEGRMMVSVDDLLIWIKPALAQQNGKEEST